MDRWLELNDAFYSKIAESYLLEAKDEVLNKEYDQKVLTDFCFNLPNDGIVLDAGCGPSCQQMRFIQERGYNTIGIDVVPRNIEIALQYFPTLNLKCMNLSRLDFEENSFIGAVSFYVLGHIPSPHREKAVSEIYRVLKSLGKFTGVVHEGVHDGPHSKFDVYFKSFTSDEVFDLLKITGFTNVTVTTRDPLPGESSLRRVYFTAVK